MSYSPHQNSNLVLFSGSSISYIKNSFNGINISSNLDINTQVYNNLFNIPMTIL